MHTHALLNAVQIPRDGGPLYGNGAVRLALSTGASPVFDQTEQLIMFDNNVKQHTEVLKWHKHIWPYWTFESIQNNQVYKKKNDKQHKVIQYAFVAI